MLGEMAELGPDAPAYHEEIGKAAAELGVDEVVGVGELARGYLEGADGSGPDGEAGIAVARARRCEPGDAVLVKGSRALGLEAVAAKLAAGDRSRGHACWSRGRRDDHLDPRRPEFIAFLRRNEFGQQIREEGPRHHVVKQGTPVMGGLLIVLALAIAFLALSHHTGRR